MQTPRDFFPELDSELLREFRDALCSAVSTVDDAEKGQDPRITVSLTFAVYRAPKTADTAVDITFGNGSKVKRRAVVRNGQLRLELVGEED